MLMDIMSMAHSLELLVNKQHVVLSVHIDCFDKPTIHVAWSTLTSLYADGALRLVKLSTVDKDTIHVKTLYLGWMCHVTAVFCRDEMEKYLSIEPGSLGINMLFRVYMAAKGVEMPCENTSE